MLEIDATELELVAGPFGFTEGPVWDGERVLFTDMPSDRVLAFEPASTRCMTVHTGVGRPNGLALDSSRRLLACLDEGRAVVRFETEGEVTVLADSFEGCRLNSPNDLHVDSKGRVWFSDPRYGERRGDMELCHESVYRVDPAGSDGEVSRVTADTARPNGIVLSADEDSLFVAESPRAPHGTRELRAYPVHMDGSLGAARVVADFGVHRGVDGMCVGPGDTLVAACGSRTSGPGPRVVTFDREGGVRAVVRTVADPTNVCFGGRSAVDLYVTSFDGCLWRLRDAWGRLADTGAG